VIDEVVRKLGAAPDCQHIRAWEHCAFCDQVVMRKGCDALELAPRVH